MNVFSRTCWTLLLAMLAAPLVRAQVPATPDNLVTPTILADTTAIVPGQPFRVGIQLRMLGKWHVYWSNGGEGGEPTRVRFTLPDGFAVSPIQFPTPIRFEQEGPIVSFGYEGEVLLIATITPPKQLPDGPVKIVADVSWLACEKICIPGEATLELSLPVAASASPAHAATFDAWTPRLPVASRQANAIESIDVNSGVTPAGGTLTVTVTWKQVPANLGFFPPAFETGTWGDANMQTRDRTTVATIDVRPWSGRTLPAGTHEAVIGFDTPAGNRRGVAVTFAVAGQ